jgi:AAA15 family ATPase/GTPase
MVIDALRIIEPSLDRIAPARSEGNLSPDPARTSIYVRLKGNRERIPVGSMGDGIWRILGLSLNLVHAREGILLIDEIDTGLHHTVMEGMWKFLYSAAEKYNVQVFATTHSRDCYESLAAISRGSVSDNSEVTIQRIERGREEAIAYTEEEIVAAAQHDIEVR